MINYKVVFLCPLLLAAGCGSSSSDDPSSSSTAITVEAETPVVEVPVIDLPVEETSEPQADITCSGLAFLPFSSAIATDSSAGYPASNAIDGSFISTSRWSTASTNQSLTLTLEQAALVKGLSITWLNEDSRNYSYDIEVSTDNSTWTPLATSELSDESTDRGVFTDLTDTTAKYIKIITTGNNVDSSSNIVEVEAFGCQSDVTSDIELIDWYLSIPVDEDTASKAESIWENDLNDDYFNSEYFFNSLDNGLVFRSPIEGTKTSENTKYTRTELREMLRRGNTSISTQGVNANNWVFSSAPQSEQDKAGGVDGELVAELSVNHVTTTGDANQVGRVIIGQIHANNDEPVRVYYRKLPSNENGSIYLAHEIRGGDDTYREIIGTRSQSASNPSNGIKLNERFGYKITVVGNSLTFVLTRDGEADLTEIIDMSNSGYDIANEYMYFKAGVYNQNDTGEEKDYVQATFYKIDNSHD
ncbi:polysaccharide lyase family 7 protein [Pseudocolwellia sp. HL-MZ19]|uniref:polysaccharide lyase family 7 protein n=1 Tax=unclassified Pseudocolwellia TaxID=2848178 RepID=UPI003CF75875